MQPDLHGKPAKDEMAKARELAIDWIALPATPEPQVVEV